MSRSRDQRIVEMELQNKNFEAHAKESLSTIDKLKKALTFEGVGLGFDTITAKAKSVDLSSIVKGVDNIKDKFSALGIFGVETMKRITNAALDAGEKMWASTFGQIQSGGKTRALNIANSKFKLEGLGVAWEEASKDISAAVDGTAYGFDAAASAAARLATAGIKLGNSYGGMAHSLKAISGIAAMTNSSYEEIGYIFSQVASLGKLQAQDAMQISTRGINVMAVLGKTLNKTTEEIQEMMRKGEISFAEFAEAMNDTFGDQAAKANETFEGALSNVKAALSRIGEIWYGPFYDAAIKPLNKLREVINKIKKAFSDGDDATRDFRDRLTDLMNIVSNILTYVIGLTNTGIFNKIAEGLNKIMDRAIYVGKAWEKFLGIADETKGITNSVTGVKQSLADLSEEELKLAKRVANGEFGNGAYRVQQLKQLTDNYELVQEAVNQCVAAGWDWAAVEKKIAAEQAQVNEELDYRDKGVKLFLEMGKVAQSALNGIKNLRIVFEELAGEIIDSFLSKVDFDDIAADVSNLFKKLEDGTNWLKNLVQENPEIRALLDKTWLTLQNIYIVAKDIGIIATTVIGKFLKSFFRTFDFGKVRDDIFSLSVGLRTFFNRLTAGVKNSDMENGFDKIWTVVNNLYRILSATGGIIIELLRSIGIVAKESFGELGEGGNSIGDVTDKIATWLENFRDWVKSTHAFVDQIRNVIDFIKKIPGAVADALNFVNDKIKEWTGVDIKESLGKLGDWIGEKFNKLEENIKKYGGLFEYLKVLGGEIKEKLVNLFNPDTWFGGDATKTDKALAVISKIMTVLAALFVVGKTIKKVKSLLTGSKEETANPVATIKEKKKLIDIVRDAAHGVDVFKKAISKMNKTFEAMINTGMSFVKSMDLVLFAVSMKMVIDVVVDLSKMMDAEDWPSFARKAAGLGVAIVALGLTTAVLKGFMKDMIKLLDDINGKVTDKGFAALAMLVLSVGASMYLMASAISKMAKAMGNTTEDALRVIGAWGIIELLLVSMMGVLEIVGNSSNMDKIGIESAALIFAMAEAINILSKAISRLAELDPAKMGLSFLAVAGMMGMYVLVVKEMSDAASKFNYETKDIYAMSVNMIAFAASIKIMAGAIKKVAKLNMNIEQAAIVVGSLAALIGSYVTVIAVLSELNASESLILTFAATTLAFGLAVKNVAKGISIIGQLDGNAILSATAAIETLFVTFAVAIGVLAAVNTSTAESVAVIMAALAADLLATGIAFGAVAIGFGVAAIAFGKAIDLTINAIERFANADLRNLNNNIDKFVEGLGRLSAGFITVAPTLGRAVGMFFGAIIDAVKQNVYAAMMLLPTLIGYYIETFFTNIKTMIVGVITGLITVIRELLKEDGEGKTLIEQLVESIIDLIVAVITAVGNKADIIAGALVAVTINFLNAYAKAIGENKEAIIAAIMAAIDATIDLLEEAVEAKNEREGNIGGKIVGAILKGILNKATEAYNTIKKFVEDRVKNFKDAFGLSSEDGRGSKLFRIGSNIISGFINGIKEKFTDAYNVAYDFFENFRSGVEAGMNRIGIDIMTEAGQKLLNAFIHDGLNENSPPPESVEGGEYLVEGVANGAMAAWENVKNTLTTIGGGLLDKFISAFGQDKLGNALDIQGFMDDISTDAEFSVTPVLDTSSFDTDYSSFMSNYGLSTDSNYNFASTSSGLANDISGSTYGTNGFYTGSAVDNSQLNASVQDIAERIGRLEVRMDTGALVGALYAGIDEKLGEKQILAGRGVYA